jgi:tRNA (guanine37-N1)-methyltransferase
MVTLKEKLKGKISKKGFSVLKRSFDIIGDIAVLEIADELKKREKIIAKAMMELYPRVKVVAKKTGPTAGVERVRPIKVILGEKRTETLHIENQCRFKLDINKVYFSPRLGSEHLRVAEQVKKKEVVYDLFAGVGPYAIPCAKRCKKIIAVDINRYAIKYLKENARLNKVAGRIDAFTGDSRKIVMNKKHKKKADRIIMNLPMHAGEFLDVAFHVAKPNSKIHFYCFLDEKDLYKKGTEMIKIAAKKAKRKIRILKKKKCGQLAPRVWRVVIDFKVY